MEIPEMMMTRMKARFKPESRKPAACSPLESSVKGFTAALKCSLPNLHSQDTNYRQHALRVPNVPSA